MGDFTPTHKIVVTNWNGEIEEIFVHLEDDGAAYTEDEWNIYCQADWVFDEEDGWLFHGRPGPTDNCEVKVVRISDGPVTIIEGDPGLPERSKGGFAIPPENTMLEMLHDFAAEHGDRRLEELSADALRGNAKAMEGCKQILREALKKTLKTEAPQMIHDEEIVERTSVLSEQQKALGCKGCRHAIENHEGFVICTQWLGPQPDAETGICIRRWLRVRR